MGQDCSCCKYEESLEQHIFVEEHQAKKRVSKIEYLQGEERQQTYEKKFLQLDFQMESDEFQQEENVVNQQMIVRAAGNDGGSI